MAKVLVYGTLKSGNPVRGLNKFSGADFVSVVQTVNNEWDLISLGAFPAAVKGEHNVLGELWDVSPEVFVELDVIEGYPEFYTRTKVQTSNGEAWMYHFRENHGLADQKSGITHNMDNTVEWNW